MFSKFCNDNCVINLVWKRRERKRRVRREIGNEGFKGVEFGGGGWEWDEVGWEERVDFFLWGYSFFGSVFLEWGVVGCWGGI